MYLLQQLPQQTSPSPFVLQFPQLTASPPLQQEYLFTRTLALFVDISGPSSFGEVGVARAREESRAAAKRENFMISASESSNDLARVVQ